MFSMIVSGKISQMSESDAKHAPEYSHTFWLKETYYDGETKERWYAVWIPKRLKSRVERLCQNDRYIGVKVETFSLQSDFNAEHAVLYIQIKALDIFIL